jgi:predicted TIM-barrel fold metal-dependent hydrolase
MYADHLLLPWVEALPSFDYFDAHTHTGANDPDGFGASAEELLDALSLVNGRAVVFTMHEPGGYTEANDRVLAEAEASDARLVPFCRVDPNADGVAEAERALARGARGIKLHPRAERFALDHPEVDRLCAIANERRLPMIVHAGRGIPALGKHAYDLTGRHPDMRLILAHCGVCDLAWLWRHAEERPNLLYDTSWWTAADFFALFSLVPPGQILMASDAPYGTPVTGVLFAARCALQVGLTQDQLECVAGRQLERVLAGQDLIDAGPAPGAPTAPHDVLLERIHSFLMTASSRMLYGQGGEEYMGLARLACDVGENTPQSEVAASIAALIERWKHYADGRPVKDGIAAPGVQVAIAACIVARTPDVALPSVEAVDLAEREEGAA